MCSNNLQIILLSLIQEYNLPTMICHICLSCETAQTSAYLVNDLLIWGKRWAFLQKLVNFTYKIGYIFLINIFNLFSIFICSFLNSEFLFWNIFSVGKIYSIFIELPQKSLHWSHNADTQFICVPVFLEVGNFPNYGDF